jgi:hypothetical protein
METCFHGLITNVTIIIPGCFFFTNAVCFTGEWGNFYRLREDRFLEAVRCQWAEHTAE